MPTPGDQGSRPTDAAWAVAYGASTCLKAIALAPLARHAIDSIAYSPGFLVSVVMAEKHTSCEQGLSILDALEVALRVGNVTRREFPSECQMTAPVWLKQRAWRNRITAFQKLLDREDQDKVGPIRQTLAAIQPVVAGLRLVPSFLFGAEVWQPTREELNRGFGGPDTVVAMTIVGYDDTDRGGVFEVMASLGTGWGKGGFAKISYQDFAHLCLQAFSVYADSGIGATTVAGSHVSDSTSPGGAVGMNGSVTFVDNTRSPMKLWRDDEVFRFIQPYQNDQAFRIEVKSPCECYVYAFAVDSTSPEPVLLFPDAVISATNLLMPDSTLLVPDPSGRSYCVLDANGGENYLCILLSRRQLDVKGMFNAMRYVSGTLLERVTAALTGECVPVEEIKSEVDVSVRFWTSNIERQILPLVFVFERAGP